MIQFNMPWEFGIPLIHEVDAHTPLHTMGWPSRIPAKDDDLLRIGGHYKQTINQTSSFDECLVTTMRSKQFKFAQPLSFQKLITFRSVFFTLKIWEMDSPWNSASKCYVY